MSEPVVEFNEHFSEPGAGPVPWAVVENILDKSEMFWLSTVRGDGRPHVTPLPTVWRDGALHFCAGSQEQKTANLRSNPNVVLTTGTNDMHSGVDVVVEGIAMRVTDRGELADLAAQWKSKLDWDFQVGDAAFKDPAGRDGLVFRVVPAKVLSFGKGPYSQTRYRFV